MANIGSGMTREQKLEYIKFKETDDEHIRVLKAGLQFVMSMNPEERTVFFQEQCVAEEQKRLQSMIEDNEASERDIKAFTNRAKKYVSDYEQLAKEGDPETEGWLEAAELCIEIVKQTTKAKHSISEIRKQRERVQWERKKLKKIMSQSSEPSQSSSPSKT